MLLSMYFKEYVIVVSFFIGKFLSKILKTITETEQLLNNKYMIAHEVARIPGGGVNTLF